MEDDMVWSGVSMTAGRNLARAVATVLAVLIVLAVGCGGVALAAEPVLAIDHPVADSYTNNQTPTFSGTTNDTLDPVTLKIYEGPSATGLPVQTLTDLTPLETGLLEASWEVTPTTLEQGEYTAVAEQTAGGETGKSAVTFTVVTTPAVSINPVAPFTKDSTPKLSGSAGAAAGDDPTVDVTIYQGGSVGGTVAASESVALSGSSWSFTPGKALAEGTYTAQATQEDKAGDLGESTPPVTFTVVTKAPAVTINSVAPFTKNTTPTLTGDAGVRPADDPSVDVTIYEGSVVGGTVAASEVVSVSGSTWSFTPGKALAEGTYTAQATQEDKAGDLGESTPPVTFTVVTKAPAVTINSVAAFTKNAKPTLSGDAGALPGDDPSVTVTIYKGPAVGGTVAQSSSVARSGSTWSFTAAKLAEGTYTAQATQEDEAGNLGKSGGVTFAVVTKAPAVTVNSVAAFTKNTTPTLTGDAGVRAADDPSVDVTIYEGSVVGGTVAASEVVSVSGSTWSFTPGKALAEGTYTAQATQEDKAGNLGKSTAVTFTVVTKAPAVTINSVAAFTKNTTPTLTGNAGVRPADDTSVDVTIYEGSVVGGTVAASEVVSVSGSTWSFTPGKALAEGTYTAQATQEDKAGNLGKSTAVTFTVVTVLPAVTINSVAAFTKNTTPTLTGNAGVRTEDDASVDVTIYDGSSVGGTVAQSSSVARSGSTWSFTPGKALAEGTYTAQATQEDEAGNLGKSAAVTFTVVTAPPAVTINPPAPFTKNVTPTLTGNAGVRPADDASVDVTVYEGSVVGGTVAASEVVSVSGSTWSFTPGKALNPGTYTAQATQEDKAGNVGKSASVTFTVVTTGPAVTINPFAAFTKSTTPTLTGAAGVLPEDDPSVDVTIYEGSSAGGKVAASETVTPSGSSWSFTPGKALAEGTYTAQATQEDKAGNLGKSAAVTFTVVTKAPAVTINSVAAFTKNTTPTLTGNAGVRPADDTSVDVTVYEGSVVGGTVAASGVVSVSGSTWSFTPGKALAQGTYTAQATQEDKAGNVGKSTTVTFTVKTTPPAVTINAVPTPTKDTTPTFSGAGGEASGDQPSVTVKIYKGIPEEGVILQSSGVPVSAGLWSYTASTLSEGSYTVQVSQSDAAGNVRTLSVAFTVLTTPPAVTINQVGPFTKAATPTLSGTAGVAVFDHTTVTVNIYKGETVGGTLLESPSTAVGGGGAWSDKTPPLPDGTYTVQATQEDDAGNVGKSTAMTFTVVTVAPAVTITPVGAYTNKSTPTLTGGAGVRPVDDPSVDVTIYEGSSPSGKIAASETVSASGATWSFTPGKALPDGTYTAQATQEDKAGNVGKSAATTFIVDTVAPVVTLTVPAKGAKSMNTPTPRFSGLAGHASGDEALVTVNVFEGSSTSGKLVETQPVTPAGGSWTATSADELKNGTYTVQAEQSDAAGNVGKSLAVTFKIATELTLETSGETSGFAPRKGKPGLATGPTPSFTGTADTADGTKIVVTIFRIVSGEPQEVPPPMTVTRSGARWKAGPFSALADGTYLVRVEQEGDEEGTVEEEFTVDADAPHVTLSSPANDSSTSSTSQSVGGSAGTAEGDLPEVTVRLFAGSTIGGSQVASKSVGASGTSWSATLEGLGPGTYTARAEQSDDVGNVGQSEAVTFTLTAPPAPAAPATASPPSPPVASFRWVPSAPHAGEAVTLISTSTDASSPITGFAWALAGNGVFSAGEAAVVTSFATAGAHAVQLRVTDANGLSNVVTETIAVTSPAPALMQPFPVVHMAGSYNGAGVKISLLTVLTPVGATVTVTCRGGGCPTKSEGLVAASRTKSKTGTVLITFRRFEHSLRAGAVLEIWVSNHGQIGKFTRFVIHHNKVPSRQDLCLNPAGTAPIVCPSS